MTQFKNAVCIVNQKDRAACALAGLPIVKEKVVTFRKLAQALRNELPKIEQARTHAQLIDRALFGLRITKAACDAMVSVLTTMTSFTPAAGVGKAIGIGYGFASDGAGAASKVYNGQAAGADIAKIGLNAVAAGAGHGRSGNVEFLAGGGAKKSGMLVDAMNGDADGVVAGIVGYLGDIAKYAGEVGKAGPKGTIALSAGAALGSAAWAFVTSYRDLTQDAQGTKDLHDGLKSTILQQITTIEKKVAMLEKVAQDYEAEIAKHKQSQQLPHPAIHKAGGARGSASHHRLR